MKNYVLYMHTNKTNHKKYIGFTCDTKRRWRNNGIEYKPHKKENMNRFFWNAICKYGFDSFEHTIILENLSFKEACIKEIEYIEKYNTTDKNKGYNVSSGGNGGKIYTEHPKGMLGKKHSKVHCNKQTERLLHNDKNCMTNGKVVWGVTHKHPKGMKGKTHSDEYKKRVSEFMIKQHPNFKKCFAIFPDGSELEFKSPKFLCEYFKIAGPASSIYLSMKKEPYKVKHGSKTKRYDLEGIMIRFESNFVNTEVN